jgi:hypothetical protein
MKYSVLILFFICACGTSSNKKESEKSQDLLNYYRSELKTSLPQNGIIIILQNQQCSSCRLSTFERLSEILKNDSLQKTFILGRRDPELTNIISRLPNNEILIDSTNKRKDYGLDYAADLFFLFKENKLKKWFEISNDNMDNKKTIE